MPRYSQHSVAAQPITFFKPDQPFDSMLYQSGMDFTIKRAAMAYKAQDQSGLHWKPLSGHETLYHSETLQPLSVVSPKFQIFQPRHTFEFFRDLISHLGFRIKSASTLFGGKRFWVLAEIGEPAAVLDDNDKIGRFLLLSSSCDGSMATEARFLAWSFACNNALKMVLKQQASVRVTHRTLFSEADAKKKLGLVINKQAVEAEEQFAQSMELFRRLASYNLRSHHTQELTLDLLLGDDARRCAVPEDIQRRERCMSGIKFQRIMHLSTGLDLIGNNLQGRAGQTAWSWLNAVTQLVDHESSASTPDHRRNSAWFGVGDGLKNRALELVKELV